jgi:hypothetical protein
MIMPASSGPTSWPIVPQDGFGELPPVNVRSPRHLQAAQERTTRARNALLADRPIATQTDGSDAAENRCGP